MESWSYISGGKGFITDESVSAPKNGSTGWELNAPCSFGSNNHQAIENQGFVELGFPDLMRKSLSNGSIRDVLGSKVDGGSIFHPVTSSHNVFFGENESSSKLSGSVVESNCRDSALIDLKLGRFADLRETHHFNSSNKNPNSSSARSSMSTKRVRVGNSSSSIPFCQVHGCKKDLSSSKDYHKRHKVCEVHSKTAKVIVNGTEQRFCQQCSRFHLLPEFDDGKRSCRKRLAGHNERRRKPHVGIHYGRTGRLFQSYKGTSFQGNAVTTSSFICQDILPSNLVHPQKYDTNNWCRYIKVEDMTEYSSQSAITISTEQIHPRSLFPSYGFEKHCPPTETGTKFNGRNNTYKNDPPSSNFGPRSPFQNTSLGGEGLTFFDAASTIQAVSGVSDSGHALSLLSSPSQNSSCHSSIPMGHPLIIPGSQVSDKKLFGVGPQTQTTAFSNKFHFSGTNLVEGSTVHPIPVSDGSDVVNFGFDPALQGPEFTNTTDRILCEVGPTIDLLQLSSQLQEVEHQRQSLQVKQENYSFCGLRITGKCAKICGNWGEKLH